jgi:2-polyprenyl-3-methyl-5-hydroxy-6-metoxy-1,4-benzoquinol methylase
MEFINQFVLSSVPANTRRLLDLGCGNGWLGREVKKKGDCYAVGITISKDEAAMAKQELDRVIICDLNNFDLSGLGEFDCIVCSHVLEHLHQPQELLKRLSNNLTVEGVLIVALPNIVFWKHRWEFLKGRFRYIDATATDWGHLRFFDCHSAGKLLEASGYRIVKSRASGNFPLPVIRKILPRAISSWIDNVSLKYFPGFFGVQSIFVAKKSFITLS